MYYLFNLVQLSSNNNILQFPAGIKPTIKNLKIIDTDSGDRFFPSKDESNFTSRLNINNEPINKLIIKNSKTINVNNNNVFRKPIGKNNENGHTKNAISNPMIAGIQLSSKNAIQGNSSPSKLASHVSSLNNNLLTNNTDNAKELLTIKTSSLEGESINPSPTNFKFLLNNLNTISSKITPTNSNNLTYNFKENIKILDNNSHNENILDFIQKFGTLLKTNINFNSNALSEENAKRLNQLNETLKSMNFIFKKQGNSNVDMKKPLHTTKNCKKGSYDLQKFIVAQDNNNKNKTPGSNKQSTKIVSKLFSPLAVKSMKINFDFKFSFKNQLSDTQFNISQTSSSQNPIDCKVSSAKTKERIINEIYTNSDFRIKKYKTLFDFLDINIKDIKEMIETQTKIDLKSHNCSKFKFHNNKDLNLEDDSHTHIKKMNPKINEKQSKDNIEEKSYIFSSISILNSTLMKAKLEDLTSNKIIELSKNNTYLHLSQKADICDFNESDIQEYDDEEFFKSPRFINFENQVKDKKNIIDRNQKKNTNILSNLSRSFIISSINSDFYKYFVEDSFNNYHANTISNEMSVLKGYGSGLCDGFEQSTINKKCHSRMFSDDLEKTIENIQRMYDNLLFKKDYSVSVKKNWSPRM